MSNEEWANRMRAAMDERDKEVGHSDCDQVLAELVRSLGYSDVVDLWEQQTKWYA